MSDRKSVFSQFSDLYKVPGNKGPILRLGLVAVTIILGLVLTILALPHVAGGFGDILTAVFTGIMTTILAAALIWGFAKWAAFIFPKTRALANGFWNSLTALGLIGLAIKVMVWLWLYLLPVPLYGLVLLPLSLLVSGLSMMSSEILAVIIFALLAVGSLAFMILLDVCHLTDRSWKAVLQDSFQKITVRTRKVFAFGKR